VLNFRLAHPAVLIDINRLPDLSTIDSRPSGLALGALTRQRALERSDVAREACPLLAQALTFVGHPQIRNRGTVAGSLAHADPAAELPAVAVAADAQLRIRKSSGERVVAADDFFVGQLTTVLEPDEMLVGIDIPAWPERTGSAVQEIAMRLGDFALAGVATTLTLDGDGRVSRARIVCFGVDDRPVRQQEAEQSLVGTAAGDAAFEEAGRLVSARLQPTADIHASGEYRKRVAGTLTQRALSASLGRIKQGVVA
jgi:carbon-monoxide dehydrogenase medium subunit